MLSQKRTGSLAGRFFQAEQETRKHKRGILFWDKDSKSYSNLAVSMHGTWINIQV